MKSNPINEEEVNTPEGVVTPIDGDIHVSDEIDSDENISDDDIPILER